MDNNEGMKKKVVRLKQFSMGISLSLLVGCSSVPDALNPVEWYKGARDAIASDDTNKKKMNNKNLNDSSIINKNEKFPKLSSVPEKPRPRIIEERKGIAKGLVGDKQKARKYSNEILRDKDRIKSSAPPPMLKNNLSPKSSLSKDVTAQSGASISKKMKLRIQNSPKLRVNPHSAMLRIPARNPNPPKLAIIPNIEIGAGNKKTVVVSANGVQNIKFSGRLYEARSLLPSTSDRVSGIQNLSQLNSGNLQGSYQIATILFANGSSKVRARDRKILRKVLAQYKKVGGTLRVVGHASRRTKTNDPIRHKMANFYVSSARADRVAKELLRMGVKANKLMVRAMSDRRPIYFEHMPAGEAGNRRAEIFIDF